MVGQLASNGWRATHSRVNLTKVVSCNKYADCGLVVFKLPRPTKTEADESFVEMSYREIRPFNVAGANAVAPWSASLYANFHSFEWCW